MTDTEDGAIGLRREPGYRELDCEEQQRAGNAVDELCSEVVPDNVLPRVVVPSALDDTTRQVLELRRRHGYQVPEFFELNGYARSRVEHGADPDVFVSDWRVVNSDGEAPPRRLWTTGEYVVFAGTAFVGVFLLCAAIGTLLAVLGLRGRHQRCRTREADHRCSPGSAGAIGRRQRRHSRAAISR